MSVYCTGSLYYLHTCIDLRRQWSLSLLPALSHQACFASYLGCEVADQVDGLLHLG
jgi:hypothetical protein